MEQEPKVLNDEDVKGVVGGNDFLSVKIEKGESQQSGLVSMEVGRESIYSPIKLPSQSSDPGSEKLIASHRLPIQAGMGGGKEASSDEKLYKFQMPSDGVYLGGVTFELTKTD